jgi:hypothetical protein
MTIHPEPFIPPHLSATQRNAERKQAQRRREAEESRHDKLCIALTAPDLKYCWCLCKICWDRLNRRCICIYCPCEKAATLQFAGIPAARRTLYSTYGPGERSSK